jgi:hypothetical protein
MTSLIKQETGNMKVKKSGIVLAGVAAALLASGVVVAAHNDTNHGKVKCEGSNSCKGKGACKSAKNGCKGQNSCKGKGLEMKDSEKECKEAGGTVAK